jgi:type I restriction enzyme S subunit
MAKISYSDHVKKSDISVILAEIVFKFLNKKYQTVPLSKVVDTSSGGTPSRTNPQYYGGEIPWLKSGELNDSVITDAEEFITEEGLKNSSAKVFPKGTLLVAMYGATAGKTGILEIDASTNQAVCSITPKDTNINTDFLFWFFRAHRFHFIDISRGGAQPNISQGVISKTLFPVVPKETQEEFATFLTNAEKTKFIDYSAIPSELHHDIKSAFNYLHCLRSLESENTNQKTYLTQLRQAILQEAIEGKLTADWRVKNPVQKGNPDHDAQALLETIKAEKQKLMADGKIKKEKPLAPINPDDVPFALPDGWVWVRLLDLCLFVTDGDHQAPPKSKDGVPFLVISNVSKGFVNFENTRFVSHDYFDSLQEEKKPKHGDLLYTVTGSYGIAMLLNETKEFCVQRHIGIIKPSNLIIGKYLHKSLLSTICKRQADKVAWGVAQKTVPLSGLRNFYIPLPPLAEQNAIVERVDRLLESVNALELQVTERKSYAQQLMQAVLKEAFAG